MTGRDKTDILVDLIKMNEENTNKKMDMLGEKLIDHVDDNKNDFNELKSLIKDLSHHVKEGFQDNHDNTIKPIHHELKAHSNEIQKLKRATKDYVKVDLCKQNEEVIKTYFMKYIKKLVVFNIVFLVLYIVLLYNSNIQIEWNGLLEMIGAVKKIF